MNINANRSLTLQDMARVFNGSGMKSPEQVGSDIFLGSSQGYDYLQDQGRNLGIGDPVEFFQQQQLQKQMATTPSGGMMEMMRLAGMPSNPGSFMQQELKRNVGVDALMAKQAVEARGLASLQQAKLDQQYPLPTPGSSLTLSPVMSAAMRQSGETNSMTWMMKQRLGANRGAVDNFSAVPDAGISAEDLYNEPSFRTVLNSNPQKAAQVFQALTNQNLEGFGKLYQERQLGEQKFGIETLRKAFAEGDASVDEKGNLRWRKKVFDPATNKMVATQEYEEGTPFQRGLKKHMPHVSSEVDEARRLMAEKAAYLAKQGRVGMTAPPQGVAPQTVQGNTGALWTGLNALGGMAGDIGRTFSGDTTLMGNAHPEDFGRPGGRAVIHARQMLQSNPRFQQLMRTNPQKARQIIMAIQQGTAAGPEEQMY